MTDEEVEAVARALFRNADYGDCCDVEFMQDEIWRLWPERAVWLRHCARAAIVALDAFRKERA